MLKINQEMLINFKQFCCEAQPHQDSFFNILPVVRNWNPHEATSWHISKKFQYFQMTM